MKCSNTECGLVGSGSYCQECGHRMVEEQKSDIAVKCNGKLDNGNVCGKELLPGTNYCPVCGTKVDKTFICQKCAMILKPHCAFCTHCGSKNQEPMDSRKKDVLHVDITEQTGDACHSDDKDRQTLDGSTDVLKVGSETDIQEEEKLNGNANDIAQSKGQSEGENCTGLSKHASDTDGKEHRRGTGNEENQIMNGNSNAQEQKQDGGMHNDDQSNIDEGTSVDVGIGQTRNQTGENVQNQLLPRKAQTSYNKVIRGERCIDVEFNVIISKNFKFERTTHTCFIVFGNEELGGWNCRNNVLEEVRHLNDHMYQLKYEKTIPTRLVSGRSTIPYKYLIVTMNEGEDNEIWEHYVKGSHYGQGINRELSIKKALENVDVWIQFDYFIECEPKGFKGFVDPFWHSRWKDHVKTALFEFCPNISTEDKGYLPIEGTIDQFKMLLYCASNIYLRDARCWTSHKEFMKWMSKHLIDTMTIRYSINGKNSRQSIAALFCLYVLHSLEMDMPDKKTVQLLSKSLLVNVDNASRECQDLVIAEKIFSTQKQKLLDVVVKFVKHILTTITDPCWLYVMPWVHFLSGKCAPFQHATADVEHDREQPVWWGLSLLKNEVDSCKKARLNAVHMEHLKPLFLADYLLPRTILAAVDLDNLQDLLKSREIPIEACLAHLTYRLKTHTRRKWVMNTSSREETMVINCVETVLHQLQETHFSEECDYNQWNLSFIIASHLFFESLKNQRVVTTNCCAQIFIHCVAMYDRLLAERNSDRREDTDKHWCTLTFCAKEAVKWLRNFHNWETEMTDIFNKWNNTYAPIIIQSENVRDEWNTVLSEALFQNLKQMTLYGQNTFFGRFVQLYCTRFEKFNPSMQECMGKAVFFAISQGKTVDYGFFSSRKDIYFGGLLSEMFIVEWKKTVKTGTESEETSLMTHLLRWPPLLQYLKLYNEDQGHNEMLTTECLQKLEMAVNLIERKLKALLSGALTIGDLKIITEKGQRFSELGGLVQIDENATCVQKALKARQREYQAFHEQAEQMTTLASLCKHLEKVNTSSIDTILKKLENIDKHPIKEFYQPTDMKDISDIEGYTPNVCTFKVSDNVLRIVPILIDCTKSGTFVTLWTNKCDQLGNQCPELDDVVEKVWNPVKDSYDKITNKIITGEIKFVEFEEAVVGKYKDNYDQITKELTVMRVPPEIISQRVNQLQKNRQLEVYVTGAKVLLGIVTEYGLNDDFESLSITTSHGDNTMEMRSFNDSVMNTCDFITDLTKERAACLMAFQECGKLVKWLKESMQNGGLKELKVFVDLAFLSAGDEPMNIARVQCLHSSVTGYAPLIFDLTPECGYEGLLELCTIVWKELEANPKLPQMLYDTNTQLEWMQGIKKAHGSVEVTSLMQADAINACGIYTIGKNAWQSRNQNQQHDPALMVMSDIFELSMMEQQNANAVDTDPTKGQPGVKSYTFSQLQDLHSRLMLVAGKAEYGSENVDRFTMVFDSLTRLCNVYLKLNSSGCVLFKDWTAKFYCKPDRPVCVNLEFGKGVEIKGRRSDPTEFKNMVSEIANFMEKCLDEWLQYFKDKRKKYLYLNYFTIDQLVILQRELVKVGTEQGPSHLIYPLLSAVKQDCSTDDVMQTLSETKDKLETDIGSMEAKQNEDDDACDKDEQRKRFVQEVVSAGYNEHLAIVALNHVDIEDIEQGVIWCMEHGDVDESNQDYDAHLLKCGWNQTAIDIQTLISDNIARLGKHDDTGVKPLINDLSALWKQFLESLSSDIRDYLSLEQLGLILKCLSTKDNRKLNRTLSPVLKEGEPNLIICPSADVLMTTLSVYVNDRDQPLPQSDEVLMCTPNTTKDEVDIFWRRAIFGRSRKIHCLVNADTLDYDVGNSAERYLEEYLLEAYHEETSYRLVVICSLDNENRSTIISSLDKYKRPLLTIHIDDLRHYLVNKLQVQDTQTSIKPAAFVDNDRSSVRVIKSWRAGVGKSVFKTRREDDLYGLNKSVRSDTVSIPLQEKILNLHYVIERLIEHSTPPGELATRLFHIDVSHEVQNGVDYLLFNLLILGCLMDKTGWVWRRSSMDMYLIETMPLMMQTSDRQDGELQYVHPMLNILPDVTCRSPVESLKIYMNEKPEGYKDTDQLFDDKLFRSPEFQRPFQYLLRLDQRRQLIDINPNKPEGNHQNCLQTLLSRCGLDNPSWSELHNFVSFLNTQLVDFEKNNFVSEAAAEDLPGFAQFVLRFLMQMSRDFSTRSLDMSEESPRVIADVQANLRDIDRMETDRGYENIDDLKVYQMRRTWESSPHPYIFFNSDRFTFTFLGFNIDRISGNLIDQQTRTTLEKGIMARNLYDALVRNHAPLKENFDALPRPEKIQKLCNVMGIDMPHDPDDSYELTTDNMKKILAIYMRFRSDIPVIIMGETGCGKTRLIKFMCSLQVPPGLEATNMILMKVHGGTTHADIVRKVREAEEIATRNIEELGAHIHTVLFFDEANTTEAIGMIKEIMCDKSMGGKKLTLCENLKMVAACNPYRKHSDEMIRKLEQSGLGYHVHADETFDKLGRVPMRRLVYRVQPLPQSLLPLVWDFGQLSTQTEDLYIRQMVRRYIQNGRLPEIYGLKKVVSAILTASQDYMRTQKDECSFVSLRDVDRVLTVMSWFYLQNINDGSLFKLMDEKIHGYEVIGNDESDKEEDDEDCIKITKNHHKATRPLILALGVCYHACLKTRPEYRQHIARYFRAPCSLPGGDKQIKDEIESCQEVFLDHVQLDKNIARNMALKENVFMMVVCIELRIPLFLVGKPGSSKSLAKIVVSDALQGNAARQDLFRKLKQAQMLSFQCSPLSTPDGIVGTFRQCAQFQKDKDLDTFVSVVVLDEVGLAEDSPKMPLKTLHPLLEDGCQGDEKPEKHKKVAFIGISNWALDPAKMNRGILVQREVPDLEELKNSAKGICQTEDDIRKCISSLIEPMAVSYLEIFQKASKEKREFFGLRDFYSLVKMVYSFVEKSKKNPTWHEMLHAIKRNFGGLDQVNPVESFKKNLSTVISSKDIPYESDPDCSPAGLIHACLFDTNRMESESRYLLLLTENYGALSIIQQEILSNSRDIRPITIFGSSFRSDQEYTQVCRNINKIKVCMETGNTVVLLNLENLYESLYDALNQYYVYFGGERYVDLGLGTHRVKCLVHKKFRLIVVAKKQTVYDKFPIPLINRLEKHFLTINTMLSEEEQEVVVQLEEWAKHYVSQRTSPFINLQQKRANENKIGDVFIGYHDDTCSAIVSHVWKKYKTVTDETKRRALILKEVKYVLLWCATPESVVRLKHDYQTTDDQRWLSEVYNRQQAHDSLMQYLNMKLVKEKPQQSLFAQVTTHSKLITAVHTGEITKETEIGRDKITFLETLSSFDTEQQFTCRIVQHIKNADTDPSLIIIQCDSGDVNANLIASARYCVLDEFEKSRDDLKALIHVVFIIQLPRGAAFTGFQCGVWHSVHIDDLYTEDMNMPTLKDMHGKSIGEVFSSAIKDTLSTSVNATESMDTEDGMNFQHGIISGGSSEGPHVEHGDQICDRSFGPYDEQRVKYGHNKLNIKGVILNCVQAALSMVKDSDENKNMETDRVAFVLTLLNEEHEGEHKSFLNGICSLIAKLQKDKESTTLMAHMTQNWLIEEAASNESINKTGTFRRSCLQTLENKIAPILAGIIACLDTNDNLKILRDTQTEWKRQLWLRIMNAQNAIDLEYKDLQSPCRQSELKEVVVTTTGCEGHSFIACFPFSWLVILKISEILNLTSANYHSNDDDKEVIEKAVKVLEKDPVGDAFVELTDESVIKEAMAEYIQDFVHTKYHASSVHEQKLVYLSILDRSNGMIRKSPGCGLLHNLVCIHVAYNSLVVQRLKHFRAMNDVWPECSESIVNLKEEKPDHFMFKEQDFTFSAIYLLIENLTPKKIELDEQQGRSVWLNKVHKYRPVVEKVINLHSEDPRLYGDHSHQSVFTAKRLWSRVLVMKLFLEHVCASEDEDRITIKYCMSLWTFLGKETNFKEMKSLNGLETFLKSCNNQAIKQYIGSVVKCCSCESVLEGPPITLPCGDALCNQCFNEMRIQKQLQCAKCKKSLPEDWTPVRQEIKNDKFEKLVNYQKRCNTFFMDVVNQLCFADNTAPSSDVMQKLLGYIFFTSRGKQQQQSTRQLTVFDTGIDPNPVFRSFVLQLLMKTSETYVKEHLETFLQHAKDFLKEGSGDHYIELSLLVIQCIEDKLVQEASQVDAGRNHEVHCAFKALQSAKKDINKKELSVTKLYALANARMGLALAMKYVAMMIDNGTGQEEARNVIDAARTLSDTSHINWIRIFAVKYLSRCYGIGMFQRACTHPDNFIHWLAEIQDVNMIKVVEMSDRYVVCGEPYSKTREALTKVLLGENKDHLDETLQELSANGVRVEAMLMLAAHREITCSNMHPQQQGRFTTQVHETLKNYVTDCDIIKNKELMQTLMQNQLKPAHLISAPGQDLSVQGVQCLIVHFMSVMSNLKGDSTLLGPLLNLINNPQSCVQFLLPTMPQDDLDDIREALLAASQTGADGTPVFYQCPNGHPYVIGNCGRPYVVDKCKCGAEIGGTSHKLLSSNTKDTGVDGTQHGHILGRASVRGQGPKPERTMSPAYCATVRMILHLSMYLGCSTNKADIHAMIKPDIMPGQVIDFIWSHLQQDIDDIHEALGRSVDDVSVVMHVIIDHIMKSHNEGQQVNEEIFYLSSKIGRQQWETQFSEKFIQPVLQVLDNTLKVNNQLIAQDQRYGANHLLCLLYETETHTEAEDPSMLQLVPRVWRYRTPISLQHLRQEVDARISGTQEHQKQFKVLQMFLEEEHHLRALRFIPSILRLHRVLFQKYQRKLDKAEASRITVASLKLDAVAGSETNQLLQDFIDAWELVREHLTMYMCPTTLGGAIVPKKYCTQSINDTTPIAMLLPTIKEAGLCSYALLDFLMRKQNDFLDKYHRESHRDSASISTVSPREVTSAHLISYDPEHDILPLVLANCQYSFEMGKGTKIEYDFAGLERQLMDRFLFSKSRIDVGSVLQIDEMLYRTEFTNDAVFLKLAKKIPQSTLKAAVKTQVIEELKSLPDLCQILDNLDITISFLTSTGGREEDNLTKFMMETLHMKEMCSSKQRAIQVCQFRHCKSLWLLLSMQKAKVLVDRCQHPEIIFESIGKDYHDELPLELKDSFEGYMQTLSVEKLSQLVEVLHEYIILKVSVKENPVNEDYTDSTNFKLRDYLYAYVENMEIVPLDLNIFNEFPADILYIHSVNTWITAYRTLLVKQKGNLRY